jgi:hypothetical protein
LAGCENEQDLAAIKKIKAIGRKAIQTKLTSRPGIYHEVAAIMDPQVKEIEDETKRNMVHQKISYLYEQITGDQSEMREPSDDDNGEISDKVNTVYILYNLDFS